MKRKLLALLCLATALGAACSDDDGNGPSGEGRLRLVHAVPASPNLDVVIDGDTVATDLAYLGFVDYLQLSAGAHVLQVSETGTTTMLVDQDVTVADATDYTMIVSRTPTEDIDPLLLTDDTGPPPAGTIRVRAVHAAPSAPAAGVDIYVTQPGEDITLATPVASGVTFGQVLPYVEANAGAFQVRVTRAGAKDVLIDGSLTLETDQVRTVIAVDAAAGGEPLGFLVLNDRD